MNLTIQKKVLTSLIQKKSVDQKPDEDRISDLYGDTAKKNGFNWGSQVSAKISYEQLVTR